MLYNNNEQASSPQPTCSLPVGRLVPRPARIHRLPSFVSEGIRLTQELSLVASLPPMLLCSRARKCIHYITVIHQNESLPSYNVTQRGIPSLLTPLSSDRHQELNTIIYHHLSTINYLESLLSFAHIRDLPVGLDVRCWMLTATLKLCIPVRLYMLTVAKGASRLCIGCFQNLDRNHFCVKLVKKSPYICLYCLK